MEEWTRNGLKSNNHNTPFLNMGFQICQESEIPRIAIFSPLFNVLKEKGLVDYVTPVHWHVSDSLDNRELDTRDARQSRFSDSQDWRDAPLILHDHSIDRSRALLIATLSRADFLFGWGWKSDNCGTRPSAKTGSWTARTSATSLHQ
jgi:hypothetical protein